MCILSFILSCVEHEKRLITLGPTFRCHKGYHVPLDSTIVQSLFKSVILKFYGYYNAGFLLHVLVVCWTLNQILHSILALNCMP